MKGVAANNHHSLFCRTLRAMSEGGLFTTIQSMIEVAADNAYLFNTVSECVWAMTHGRSCETHSFDIRYPRDGTYQVKIYCVWLFLKLTSAGRPIGMPLASLSYAVSKSGSIQPLSARSPRSFTFSEQWKRTHGLFDPDGLTPRHVRHLVNIWKVELPQLRLVIWSEHILLPRLPQ